QVLEGRAVRKTSKVSPQASGRQSLHPLRMHRASVARVGAEWIANMKMTHRKKRGYSRVTDSHRVSSERWCPAVCDGENQKRAMRYGVGAQWFVVAALLLQQPQEVRDVAGHERHLRVSEGEGLRALQLP